MIDYYFHFMILGHYHNAYGYIDILIHKLDMILENNFNFSGIFRSRSIVRFRLFLFQELSFLVAFINPIKDVSGGP